ncbi:hypothetical protein [Erythrobacter sp.]|uniref:hypothetical protein n=1 Tax=Erythrobacter sp. TaxID=1042 RepID=UPI001B12D1D5|nr:hypothetical protein [Erythrobacter sp.]MBO6526386.1 hypothetical protein [Erythrobacter sp.]MBO6530343.1 hypothetical protein [Erythrobacter sp.]
MADATFTEALLTDVAAALDRLEKERTQSHMRDLVRTTFAAIEGAAWIFREHVIDVANSTYGLLPDEEAALSETSHQVSLQGKVSPQTRFIPLPNGIRLVARISKRLSLDHEIDFSTANWDLFLQAIEIRNRITHPKSNHDLRLTQSDIDSCLNALFWFMSETTDAMQATNIAARQYLGELGDVFWKLKNGDPATVALYKAISRKLDSN